MKPLDYFEQIIRMPDKAGKFDFSQNASHRRRLKMVKPAVVNKVKPACPWRYREKYKSIQRNWTKLWSGPTKI